MDLPEKERQESLTTNDIALIDEISGLNNIMDGVI